MATAQEQFRSAYRAYRVKRQIKWAPDHVDPEDIDPAKFAIGGEYYNSPELIGRYNATCQWHPSYKGPKYGMEISDAARKAEATRRLPGFEVQHQQRAQKLVENRAWNKLWD